MIHRRDALLRLGQAGVGGLTLPTLLQSAQPAQTDKSMILVYLWGGPPQQDMFDLKPDAPVGIKSEFLPIDTVVPGIQVCDQMPLTARHTDKMCVIRSYTHPSNVHEVGVYHTLTGKENPTLAVPRNQRARHDFPNMAGVISHLSPPSALPASVTVPRPISHDGVIYTGTYAGFLGSKHDPLELRPPGDSVQPAAQTLELPADLPAARLQGRFGLLNLLDEQDRLAQEKPNLGGLDQFREQAFRMLTSPEAKAAFDLEKESDKLRDRYGRNEFGEAFLLARRLIESGVRLVTIVWYYVCPDGNVANVWDNHGGTGSLGSVTGYQMLKEKYCLPPLDLGYSALLEDLSNRGMLDSTLVAMLGEFGRTPKINNTGGRDHWGPCQSVVLAGAGVRGGMLYGASDKQAAYPIANPVTPSDFIATSYHALGIDPHTTIYDRENRPHRLTEGEVITAVF